jgi:hypothetical protein
VQLIHDVDAAVHEADHRIAGTRPPVAITLGGFVTGQRERGQRIDEHDVLHPVPDRELVSGRYACNPCAANHYFSIHTNTSACGATLLVMNHMN